jgi:dTDP-4-dehydrorhamnose reductase
MGLELWGGHECTVVRVGDRWTDQTVRSGHQHRLDDLERFAALGIKAIRYPVLWERTAPQRPDERDFRWSDERLNRLQDLKVRPIVGLIHHGSGPHYTDIMAESFAPGLADHARAVAERYPWVRDWTPVNEPLTTARFSALYGFWYPHQRNERACWHALLNEIDATRLSMRQIRQVNPQARLIQTDDLGYTHAAQGRLASQADFENQRRWLTWDLLAGRVTPEHPLWDRLARLGFGDRLRLIADDPCPADVIGVNHYLGSERFLDEDLDRYPEHSHGGNGVIPYADVEATRAAVDGALGFETLLAQACDRYPEAKVAVTECHNGCTREEQVRWLYETWKGCERLRAEGRPIEALTAWSLLGAYDWNSLLQLNVGHYEPGVFDVRDGKVRPTAAAKLLTDLAHGREPDPLALGGHGWWRRDARLVYGAPVPTVGPKIIRRSASWTPKRTGPILITGRTGTLGQALARACTVRGLNHVLTSRRSLRLDDPASIEAAMLRYRPSAVINAAGWVRVDEAETAVEACMLANATGPELLADACARHGVPMVTYSSDLVFDGAAGRPYVESDAVSPLNVYGLSKAEAERGVLASGADALVVRTAAFFSQHDPHNFAWHVMRTLEAGEPFTAASDLFVSPTYVPDLVNATLDLLIDRETGLWHLANQGRMSWAGFARAIADAAGLDESLIEAVPFAAGPGVAPRPLDVTLDSERGRMLPKVDNAIERFVEGYAALPAGQRSPCPTDAPIKHAADGEALALTA